MSLYDSRIYKLELKVKETYAKDKSSGDFYSAVKKLAERILVVKRMAFNWKEVDEISHILATDIWIRVNKRNLSIVCWTKYIRLRLRNARVTYLNESKQESIKIDDPIEVENLYKSMIACSNNVDSSSRELGVRDLAQKLPIEFFNQFNKYVRYYEGSYEYEYILISMILSLKRDPRGGQVILYHLDSSYLPYLKFLITIVNKGLLSYCKDTLELDNIDNLDIDKLIAGSIFAELGG